MARRLTVFQALRGLEKVLRLPFGGLQTDLFFSLNKFLINV